MTKKRLLFVSAVGSKFGGAPNSLFHLLRDIHAEYELAVVMPRMEGLAEALKEIEIPCYEFNFRYRNLLSLIRLVKQGQYDLVYANGYHYRCFMALIVAKVMRKPFVWHIREVFENFPQARQVHYSTAVIANSQATATALRQYTDKKIDVVTNGIDLERYELNCDDMRRNVRDELKIPEDSIVIINVGRVCYQKNQLQVIEISSNVVKRFANVHFLFLGEIQEKAYLGQLQELALRLRVTSNIHFGGHTTEVNRYFVGSDVLIHTSRKESQGRVILEAMAAKLPVVAYDVGGIKESMINGKTGFLFPFGTIDPVVKALNTLAQNKIMREEMGLEGYSYVQRFSSEHTSRQIVAVIERVLGGNR